MKQAPVKKSTAPPVTAAPPAAGEALGFAQILIDTMSDPVYWLNRDGRLVYVNEAACQALGYTRGELLHMSIWDFTPQNWSDQWAGRWEKMQQAGHSVFEMQYRRRDGAILHIELRADFVVYNGQAYLCGIGHDITERKEAETALRENEERFRVVLETGFAAAYRRNLSSDVYEYFSPVIHDLIGFTPEELEGVATKGILDRIHPDDRESVRTLLESSDRSGSGPFLSVFRYLRKDGEYIWLSDLYRVIRDEQERALYRVGSVRDITQAMQAEEALRESGESYRRLTESLKDVVWVMDAETLMLSYISPAITRMRGYSPAEMLSQPVPSTFNPEDGESISRLNHLRAQDLREGKITEDTYFTEEFRQPRKDGSLVWTEITTRYYINPRSGRVEVLGVTHDITPRKQAELALRERVKDLTCLAQVAHLLENEAITTSGLCGQVAESLQPSVLHPRLASAVVELEDARGQAGELPADFSNGLSAPISLSGQVCGRVAVYYSQPRTFLPEEKELLENIARMLGLWLERKKAAAEVHRLTQAVEQSPLNIFITALDGKIEYANPTFWQMTGYTPAEAIGHTPQKLLSTGTLAREEYAEIDRKVLSGGVWRGEFKDRNRAGEVFWQSAVIAPLRDESGKVTQYVAYEQDVTSQKEDQARMAEALELNRTILQASPVGIIIYKASGECLTVNPAAAEIIGGSTDELLALNFRQIPSWQTSGLLELAEQALLSQQRKPIWLQTVTSFGHTVHLRGDFVPFDSGGEQHLLLMFEDYTEREQAERELLESQEKFHSIFNEAPIMIWEEDFSLVKIEFDRLRAEGVSDWSGYFGSRLDEVKRLVSLIRVVDVNEENVLFFGGTSKQEVMDGMAAIMVDESWQVFTRELAQLAQGATVFESEQPTLTMRGERKHTFLRLTVASSHVNDLARVIVSLVDITARQQAQADLQAAQAELEERVRTRTAELQAANLALEKAIHAKDVFLATMSHELRTPLTGILGLSQALEFQLKNVLTDKQMSVLETIGKSGQRLHELINDVLDFTRLQAGETSLQIGPFSLSHTFQTGLQDPKRRSQEKGQQLSIHIEPGDLVIESDERRLKQILSNLLNNAVKFTPQGGSIQLSAQALPGNAGVRISVRDTGIGIAPADQARIFEPFTQLDGRLARDYGGTGLGLALVRELAELLGGSVSMESVPGQGSTFSVLLPLTLVQR